MESVGENEVHITYVEYNTEILKDNDVAKDPVENEINNIQIDKNYSYEVAVNDVPVPSYEEVYTDDDHNKTPHPETDQNEPPNSEDTNEFVDVCESNSSADAALIIHEDKEYKDVSLTNENENEECLKEAILETTEIPEATIRSVEMSYVTTPKNYKTDILADWDMEIPQNSENRGLTMVDSLQKTDVPAEDCNPPSAEGKVELVELTSVVNETRAEPELEPVPIVSEVVRVTEAPKAEATEIVKPVLEKKKNPVKYSNLVMTKRDIVEILDSSVERNDRPIMPGKDLFFSIELAKRLNQKLAPSLTPKKTAEPAEAKQKDALQVVSNNDATNATTIADHQEIIDILEADEVKDWKPVSAKQDSREEGNDLEISQAIHQMEEKEPVKEKSNGKTPTETQKKPKRTKTIDKELERTIALKQLRDEFPSTRKRSCTTKKVNHIPFLASSKLEKALTSEENAVLKPASQRRRPCYLPENYSKKDPETKKTATEGKKENNRLHGTGTRVRKRKLRRENEIDLETETEKEGKMRIEGEETSEVDLDGSANSSVSSTVVRTYSAKRKSTDSESDIKSALETFAAAAKELSQPNEETSDSKPKKPKTVKKLKNVDGKKENKVKLKKKEKAGVGSDKKRTSEIEKLLGDEGAIRMIYDTQQCEGDSKEVPKKNSRVKTTTGLKRDLLLKAKLVKNAVMRSSGGNTEGISLRGKRRSVKAENQVPADPEPLFSSSTPNVIFYKPKKKQRAEASRILYRHSSSESFESSEGFRRTSFDADGLNLSNIEDGSLVNGEAVPLEVQGDVGETETTTSPKGNPKLPRRNRVQLKKKLKRLNPGKSLGGKSVGKVPKTSEAGQRVSTDSRSNSSSKNHLSSLSVAPVRKSSRPRVVSKKYSIWASTSMDSLSVESLGLKKPKKGGHEFAKKLNCKELIVLQHGHLFQVVLAPVSPSLKNSFNLHVLEELINVLNLLCEEETCRAVLLSSTGSTFCQGVDLSLLLEEKDEENTARQLVDRIKEFVDRIASFSKPIIAGVQAAAVGLGVTLLPYCDVVIASDRASFYTPYARLAQVTEGVASVTFPLINRLLTSELLYKSQNISALEAFKLGLVTQVVPEDKFEEELMLISRNIASQSWQAMHSIKSLTRRLEREEIARGLELESELLLKHWQSDEFLNNAAKFISSGELQLRQSVDT